MKTSKSYIVLFLFFISFNTFSQIVLNELMIRPPGTIQTPPNGLIYNSSQEYIELYNSSCSPVNITGYFIAMKQALSGTNTGGTIKIPNVPAATIPPGGHIVIGSSNAGGAVLGNIDIPLVAADYCMYNGNFVLANTDGWCALYDASGVPLDCIYWSSSAGNLTANTSDFDPGVLCLPTGTPSTVVLKTPIQINAQFPGIVKYGGSNPASGSPISRQTDGSTVLVQNLPSSIAVNNCNGGTCVPQGTFSTLPTIVQPSCNTPNGIISFNPQPTGTYFYLWPFPTTGQTSSVNNLAAGSYSITITSASGCSKDTTIVLAASNGPTAVAVTETDPGCSLANGLVAIGNVTGGTAPYQYNFNAQGFSGAQNYSNLAAGSYSLIIRDANGCEFTAPTITLISPNGPTAVAVTETDPGCSLANGSIAIGNVTGGTSPYTYSFNGGAFSSTAVYNNLATGTYSLTVKDANGCEFVAPTTTLTNPNAPTNIVYTSTNAKCDGTGGTLTVSNTTGGTAPYTYSFNGSAFTNTLNYTSINASIYSLIVKDANGCEFTESIIINANTPLSASFSATVQSGGNDTLTEVTASSGYNNSYVWNYSSQNEVLNASFINISSSGIGVTYNWIFNNGQTTDTITNNLNNLLQNIQGPNSLNVTLIVTNGDATCNDTAKILIEIKSSLIIPNIFSPNGDGINDVFLIKYKGYKELQLSVFNRWGNKYYETTKPEEGWNGDKAAEGTYFYVITGKGNDEKVFEAKGYFMLVR